MKKSIVVLSLLFSFTVSPANAVYNGEDATGDRLVSTTSMNMGCSQAPIAPRILVMAQHCWASPNQTKYVFPGEAYNSTKTVTALASFVPEGKFLGGREYDIMVVVIDKELPVVENLVIASESDIARWKENHTPISIYGYGETVAHVRPENAKKAQFVISSNPDLGNGISPEYKTVISSNPVNGISEICNGDSGGPAYVFEDGKTYYIGASISSNITNGCHGSPGTLPIARTQALYPYLDLVEKAKAYVLQNPIKSDTISIATPKVQAPVVVKPVKKVVAKKKVVSKKK